MVFLYKKPCAFKKINHTKQTTTNTMFCILFCSRNFHYQTPSHPHLSFNPNYNKNRSIIQVCTTKVKYSRNWDLKWSKIDKIWAKNINFWIKTFYQKNCDDASDYGIYFAENVTNSTAHIDEKNILQYRLKENTSQITCPCFHSRILERVENIKSFLKTT